MYYLDNFVFFLKSLLVVLFFSAQWSDESKLMGDVAEEMVKTEKVSRTTKFIQIEAEDFEDLSMKFDIEAVPTFVLLKVFKKLRISLNLIRK